MKWGDRCRDSDNKYLNHLNMLLEILLNNHVFE